MGDYSLFQTDSSYISMKVNILFYIEQHCLLLRNILSYHKLFCEANTRIIYNTIYESLCFFCSLFNSMLLNSASINKTYELNYSINAKSICLLKNIKKCFEYIYIYIQNTKKIGSQYKKKYTLLLQSLLKHPLFFIAYSQKNNQRIEAPWLNPNIFNRNFF
ncbi:hypothetical protein A6E22_00560 [Bacillus cereus]|nr:hypothetical protein CN407_24605 [Bacillus cereus]RAT14248.1 hypothetical protein A6E22_00560 [Bacillus cereus]